MRNRHNKIPNRLDNLWESFQSVVSENRKKTWKKPQMVKFKLTLKLKLKRTMRRRVKCFRGWDPHPCFQNKKFGNQVTGLNCFRIVKSTIVMDNQPQEKNKRSKLKGTT